MTRSASHRPADAKSFRRSAGTASANDKIDAWLDAISPANTNTARREQAFRQLMLQARRTPQPLFQRWAVLTRLLRAEKAFTLYPVIHLVAALVPADMEGRFERVFSAYFSLLDNQAISVAAHVAQLAGGIATARPDLQRRIERILLATERSHFDPERRGLIGAYALESLDAFFETSTQKKAILDFARRLLESPSPKARKAARTFLQAHPGAS
jgi:hypothetical protein